MLVVDDEEAARGLVGRILGSRYSVNYAASAGEAQAFLDQHHVELLLCNIHLPGECGLELAERTLSARPDIGIVMITGEDDPSVAEHAFEQGAYGYLVKPYRRGDLLITVAGALRRRELEQATRAYQLGLEESLAKRVGQAERTERLLEHSEEQLERARLETAHRLGLAVELRDQVTGRHVQRLSAYCELVARTLTLTKRHACGSAPLR